MIQDTLQKLGSVTDPGEFRKTLKIVFEGEQGMDEGGVQKEFFQLLLEQLYSPEYAMFTYNKDNKTYWFTLFSYESNLNYELFGTLLGLAIYNRVILDIRFPLVVYQKLLSIDPKGKIRFTLEDLSEVTPDMAKSLQELLDFVPANEIETTFCRDYVATYEFFGSYEVVPLCPNGENTPITGENRHSYVDDYIDWYFNTSIEAKFASFKKGFTRCMQVQDSEGRSTSSSSSRANGRSLNQEANSLNMFLTLFQPEELEVLICGSQVLNFNDWKRNTDYQDGFTETSPTVIHFWDIVINEFTPEEQKELLAFVTGSARAPPKGLGSSEARLTIGRAGSDTEQLPTAHTCFNHLLIPEYSGMEKLRTKLRLSVQNNQGFGLI